jgi:WD40 repeat protein
VGCVAVCPSGNVLIGFERESIGGNYYTVALLQAADGAVLWRADTGADSGVWAVASDTSNNCYAVGSEGTDTYSAWAFQSDGTPIWTDEGSQGNHAAAVVYGGYLYIDKGYLGDPAMARLALADGVENTDLWPIVPVRAFDRLARVYGMTSAMGMDFVYSFPATLGLVENWMTLWTDADPPTSLAVSPDGYVFVCARLTATGDGIIRCYDTETGVEQGGNFPISTVGYCDRVATTPGLYGAFPSAWMPAANIYVGNVRYE